MKISEQITSKYDFAKASILMNLAAEFEEELELDFEQVYIGLNENSGNIFLTDENGGGKACVYVTINGKVEIGCCSPYNGYEPTVDYNSKEDFLHDVECEFGKLEDMEDEDREFFESFSEEDLQMYEKIAKRGNELAEEILK